MASRTLNLPSGNFEASPRRSQHLDRVAREALSSHLGRTLTDAEWARTPKNLLEFVRILCKWEAAKKTRGLDTRETTPSQKPVETGDRASGLSPSESYGSLRSGWHPRIDVG